MPIVAACEHPAFRSLHEEIEHEVKDRAATREAQSAGPRVVGALPGFAALALLDVAKHFIKPLEDIAVASIGSTVELAAINSRDFIRSWVSDNALKLADDCLHDLMELRPAPVPPVPPPAPGV